VVFLNSISEKLILLRSIKLIPITANTSIKIIARYCILSVAITDLKPPLFHRIKNNKNNINN